MKSIINHIASSAQIALEGYLKYERELHIVTAEEGNNKIKYKVTFIADIKQNFVTFELILDSGEDQVSVKTDTLWSYNTQDMAEATAKFLLNQLLYKTLYSDCIADTIHVTRQLQRLFQIAFGVIIAIA